MEYYSVMKKNGLLRNAMTWMNLKSIQCVVLKGYILHD